MTRLLAALLAASLCSAADLPVTPDPASEGFSAERLERLDEGLQGYVDRGEVAGIVALVARHGKVVYHKSFGHRDAAAKDPMTNDVIFRIASMTKPIATTALMQLWEQGRFQLRDPISKFLPEFTDMKVAVALAPGEAADGPVKLVEANGPITFQQLLTHTSGLSNSYRGPAKPDYDALSERRREHPEWTVGDYVTELAKLPLNFQPGAEWQYGPGVDVAGRLVEVISGQPFDQYLRDNVLDPLGMDDTHFYLPKDKLLRFAVNYEPDENGKIRVAEAADEQSRYVREPHRFFSGSGGLVSTAGDYFRFQQMMLNGGELDGARILGPRTVRLMTQNHIGDLAVWLRGPGTGFGLGYAVVTDIGQAALPQGLGTFGWGGAFCTISWVDPEDGVVGVLMTQLRPYTHVNIRPDFQTLVYQAIVE